MISRTIDLQNDLRLIHSQIMQKTLEQPEEPFEQLSNIEFMLKEENEESSIKEKNRTKDLHK
jgi:hypothetical protein